MKSMESALVDHYRHRSSTYESLYFRPDESRLDELAELQRAVRGWMRGREVLEVAFGTGWFTVHAASTAKSVTAIDASEEMLALAREKPLEAVRFQIGDAFDLGQVEGTFTAALACFWVSHVSRNDLPRFLDGLHARLVPGSRVLLTDNRFDATTGGRFEAPDGEIDTYRVRPRPDGGEDKVLKNYFEQPELTALLAGMHNVTLSFGRHYWWARYETPTK